MPIFSRAETDRIAKAVFGRPGVGLFRHCNTIIVTLDGAEVDSRLPRGVLWV